MEQQRPSEVTAQRQGIFFLIVGSLTALVHFLSLIFFVQILNIHPNFANILAFLIAFLFGFTGHFHFSFRTEGPKGEWKSKLTKWFLSSLFGFMLNQAIFALGIYAFGQQYYIPIWVVATVLVTIFTFCLAKFWAFKSRDFS